MNVHDMVPGVVIQGPALSEPSEILVVTTLGEMTVTVEVAPPGGTSAAKAEETKVALREVGLDEAVAINPGKTR